MPVQLLMIETVCIATATTNPPIPPRPAVIGEMNRSNQGAWCKVHAYVRSLPLMQAPRKSVGIWIGSSFPMDALINPPPPRLSATEVSDTVHIG